MPHLERAQTEGLKSQNRHLKQLASEQLKNIKYQEAFSHIKNDMENVLKETDPEKRNAAMQSIINDLVILENDLSIKKYIFINVFLYWDLVSKKFYTF